MKVIGNFIKGFLIGCWAILSIFTTICLLTFNDYEVSEFGDYSLFIVDNRSLEPTFQKYDIVLAKKNTQSNYKVQDEVFFYYGNKKENTYINYGPITSINHSEYAEDSYTFTNVEVSYSKLLGDGQGAIVIHKLGLILGIMESQWGFMFIVILPTIYAVVYEIYTICLNVKKEKRRLEAEEKLAEESEDKEEQE